MGKGVLGRNGELRKEYGGYVLRGRSEGAVLGSRVNRERLGVESGRRVLG